MGKPAEEPVRCQEKALAKP